VTAKQNKKKWLQNKKKYYSEDGIYQRNYIFQTYIQNFLSWSRRQHVGVDLRIYTEPKTKTTPNQ
jgi:hypothetical protein